MAKSKIGQFTEDDFKAWRNNFIKFVTPTLAVFFGQLALGVSIKMAIPVALLALYQSAADYFKKKGSETKY